MKKIYHLVILLIFSTLKLLGQQVAHYEVPVYLTDTPIKIDGKLDETPWQKPASVGNFWQNFPFDTSAAQFQTQVRLCFDAQNLYISAKCFQPKNSYVVASLRRDFRYETGDSFIVSLDPFQDKLNGFNFVVSPLGVQREGLIANGNETSPDWDNRWLAEVQNETDFWTVEIAIPFKTLRYKIQEKQNEWRVNFARTTMKPNEISSWVPVPRNFFAPTELAFAGTMRWMSPPPSPGANVSLIPYLLTDYNRNFESGGAPRQALKAGLDVKVGVTPSLNLDLTFNTDFAQVEVDEQQTNLERFELFFPEKRQFFLENADLFDNFGQQSVRPFFSRRIGLTREGDPVRILAGARLSGRLDRNWRIGVMNMQTASDDGRALPGTNFSVLALQRRVFSRSNVALMAINKENFYGEGAIQTAQRQNTPNAFNQLLGAEYNLASANNQWTGKYYTMRSFTPGEDSLSQWAHGAFLGFSNTTWEWNIGYNAVGNGFNPEVGYTPRRGMTMAFASGTYTLFPSSSFIPNLQSYGIETDNRFIWNPQGQFVERLQWAGPFFNFYDNSSFFVGYGQRFILLEDDFDPTNTGGAALPAGSSYQTSGLYMEYNSNLISRWGFNAVIDVGSFFVGNLYSYTAGLRYRFQPYGSLQINVNYSRLRFPAPYGNTDFWLLGPRLELILSRKLFWSTFFQYNNQSNNININSRLQYRFKPVSDLFLVYTDNYFATEGRFENRWVMPWQPRNRALVFKLTYWLNW
jgi:Domain of unknown function (DUF5916)